MSRDKPDELVPDGGGDPIPGEWVVPDGGGPPQLIPESEEPVELPPMFPFSDEEEEDTFDDLFKPPEEKDTFDDPLKPPEEKGEPTTGHLWAMSWPGNMCKRCGAEDAMENAIGLGWHDPFANTWQSEEKRRLVELCQQYCLPQLTEPEREAIIRQVKELEEKVNGQETS